MTFVGTGGWGGGDAPNDFAGKFNRHICFIFANFLQVQMSRTQTRFTGKVLADLLKHLPFAVVWQTYGVDSKGNWLQDVHDIMYKVTVGYLK